MRRPIRTALVVTTVVAAVSAAIGADALRRVLAPTSTAPESADVVVMLAGGSGERLARSLELMRAGVAPTLVLSAGSDKPAALARAQRICGQPHDFEIVCIVPDPETTQGEAAVVGRLAAERGWRTLVLVTSDYHLDRATFHLSRCFDGTIEPVAAPSPRRPELIRHELIGFVHARTIGRGCPAGGRVL